jgi:HEAT repeat protein
MVGVNRFLLVTLTCWVASLCACAAAPPASSLSSAERIELRTLTGQLAGANRSAETKQEAALLLLTRPYPQAWEALQGFLESDDNHLARIAVAEAIARHPEQVAKRDTYVAPLMSMLTGPEPAVRAPAARALASYQDASVTRQLIDLVTDGACDKGVRLVAIGAFEAMLDKQAVDALVRLLDDTDAEIRDAAIKTLARLTSIQAFGSDSARWKAWWQASKSKPRTDWLVDLANSLAQAKTDLEAENALLRERLGRAMQDLYSATPPSQHEAALLSFTRDPLADVRLAGLDLARRRLTQTQGVSAELAQQVRVMLGDKSPRVRRSASLLVAAIGGEDATTALLARLTTEPDRAVREGLLTALGQLRDARALPAVLESVGSPFEEVAAAAALALGRIAEAQPLAGPERDQAIAALASRYHGQRASNGNGKALREALLSAMGLLGDPKAGRVLEEALQDSAATVRLAAVNGLARLGRVESALALVKVVQDDDRGVRQAAIAALGRLDGAKHLQTILDRTRAEVEADAAVRRQAWEVVTSVLTGADAEVLWEVHEGLSGRDDALEKRTEVAQMLVEALKAGGDSRLAEAQRSLAGALMAVGRSAEAAADLAEAVAALQASDDPSAGEAWLEWVEAMLAAADPTAVAVIAREQDAEAFSAAQERLAVGLERLITHGEHAAAATIARGALEALKGRLDEAHLQRIQAALEEATARLAEADRQRVLKLLNQVRSSDTEAARGGVAELSTMGTRAVGPLLVELKRDLGAGQIDPRVEQTVIALLAQIAPELTGYDATAPIPQRLEAVESWLSGKPVPAPVGEGGEEPVE